MVSGTWSKKAVAHWPFSQLVAQTAELFLRLTDIKTLMGFFNALPLYITLVLVLITLTSRRRICEKNHYCSIFINGSCFTWVSLCGLWNSPIVSLCLSNAFSLFCPLFGSFRSFSKWIFINTLVHAIIIQCFWVF